MLYAVQTTYYWYEYVQQLQQSVHAVVLGLLQFQLHQVWVSVTAATSNLEPQ